MSPVPVSVDPQVFARFPHYRCLALAAAGLSGGPSDAASDTLLASAEQDAASAPDPGEDPRVLAWREAFRACGFKPRSYRPSHEALLLRRPAPRVNALVDTYNAISLRHRLPVGGEDLDRLAGADRLTFAAGDEPSDVAGGDGQPQPPGPGEPIWRDDRGVTCRRWCWRQGPRTALGAGTTRALFLLERLDGLALDALNAAGDDLERALYDRGGAELRVERALLGPESPSG